MASLPALLSGLPLKPVLCAPLCPPELPARVLVLRPRLVLLVREP